MARYGDRKKHKGFTIVELLIVIVVIAILAAISIVAYNGVQQRARNQQMVTAAKQVYKAITAYVIDNGSYPITGGTAACVGKGYPTDASGLCWTGVSNLSANALLAPYLNDNVPQPPMERLGISARGMLMNTATGNFEFTIINDTTCPSIGAPPTTTQTSGADLWCRVLLPPLN